MTRTPRTLLLAGAAGLALVLSSCAADDVAAGGGSSSSESPTASGETIVVGGANFTEMAIMQAMYVELLEDAGYQTETVSVDNRELYFDALASGEIDVVPEYAATLAEFLNLQANGEGAAPIATNDAAATVAAARPLAEARGVELLEPTQAANQNAFAVTERFAEENGLTTLSDLAARGLPVALAAPPECATRPFCQPGLEATYGLSISSLLPLGFSTPETKAAVQAGQAQLGLVGTTDGTLGQFRLVILEDDKHLQLADNLVPALAADTAEDAVLTEKLNSLAEVLTTEDLAILNGQVDSERLLAEDVAHNYLLDHDLVS